MIAHIKRAVAPLALALAAVTTPAMAASSPYGIWIDHTGRGAVEITDCGGKLCGHLVWFQDSKNNKDGCNFQVIGNVKSVGGNKWDNGWIVDPDKDPNKKYDVEITAVSDQKLKVMGYAGMKFLSETMMWTRAPADLKKCSEDQARAPDAPAPTPGAAAEPTKDAPAAAPESTPPPAAEEETKPAKTAAKGKKKDCKMDVGFAVITFPCPE